MCIFELNISRHIVVWLSFERDRIFPRNRNAFYLRGTKHGMSVVLCNLCFLRQGVELLMEVKFGHDQTGLHSGSISYHLDTRRAMGEELRNL